MKYPKHITLDVSNASPLSFNQSPSKHYDTLYKFSPHSSGTTVPQSTFATWLTSQKTPSSIFKNLHTNPLLELCGLNTPSSLILSNPQPLILKLQANPSLNSSLNKTLFSTDARIESKLVKTLGAVVEQPIQTLFNIWFLRKEEIYTKLKYSRCPQYDMVSGGLAALFAAFLGFLICEKFGLELLDSGDFYIAFMYGVFATFSLRPLIKSMTKGSSAYNVISPKHLFNFLFSLFNLLVKYWK